MFAVKYPGIKNTVWNCTWLNPGLPLFPRGLNPNCQYSMQRFRAVSLILAIQNLLIDFFTTHNQALRELNYALFETCNQLHH